MAEPWMSNGMGWNIEGQLPGHLAELRRLERLERAERARAEAEAQERRDERLERWAARRIAEKSFRGEPFDPGDLRSLAEPEGEMLERVFAGLEAADRREYIREQLASGELHLLDAVAPAPSGSSGTEPAGSPSSAGASALRSKIRSALARWDGNARRAERRREAAKGYEVEA